MLTVHSALRPAFALLAIAIGVLLLAGCTSHSRLDAPAIPVQNPETDFSTTRIFDASPEQVWRAWTVGEHLRQWWGPTGFTCPVAEMDVRVGGTSLVAMQAPPEFGGGTYYNSWTYTAVIPPRRLDFIVRFTDERGEPLHPSELGLPPGIPPEVPHVLIIEPTEDGGAALTIIEYGYGSQDAINLSRQGLEQCLDKLAESLR